MKFSRIARQAKRLIDQRGGTDALKEDARELQNIAKGPGTMQEKAKRAKDALKEPGADRSGPPPVDESEVRSSGTHEDDHSHTPPASTGKTPPPRAPGA